MTTIVTINGTDYIKDSREDINDNFDYLNTDKLEASDIANFETTSQLNTRDTNNRNRANHTGTQTASTISDFSSSVSSNTDVSENTSARHTNSNKTILDNTTASFTTTQESKLAGIEAGANIGVVPNTSIIGATKTKITYDGKGLVTGGTDLIESDIPTLAQSKITNLTTDLGNRELLSNKSTTLDTDKTSDTKYPSVKSVYDWAVGLFSPKGAITSSGLTQATGKLLGRSTASTGAIEEITLGTNLSFDGTTLNAEGGGGSSGRRLLFAIAGAIGATGSNVANTVVVDGTYTISQVNMWYGTIGGGATALIVDVNLNGTSICSTTKPTITTTNQSAINTGTITTTSCVSGNVFTVDIDQIQSTPGVDLYIELILT